MSRQHLETADAVFSAIAAGYQDPYRLELYMARVALLHLRQAIQAVRAGDPIAADAHGRVYRQIARGLIASGYWEADAGRQVSVGPARPHGARE